MKKAILANAPMDWDAFYHLRLEDGSVRRILNNDQVVELAYDLGFTYDFEEEDEDRSEAWAALDYLDAEYVSGQVEIPNDLPERLEGLA